MIHRKGNKNHLHWEVHKSSEGFDEKAIFSGFEHDTI